MSQVKIYRVRFERKFQNPKEVFVFAKDETSAVINALNDPSVKAGMLKSTPGTVDVDCAKDFRLEIVAQPGPPPEPHEKKWQLRNLLKRYA